MYLRYNEEIEKAFKSGKTMEELTEEVKKEIEKGFKKYEEQQEKEKKISILRHNAATTLYDYLKATGNVINITPEIIEKCLSDMKLEIINIDNEKAIRINSFPTSQLDIFSLFNI